MKCDARTGRAGVSPLPCGRCPTCCHPYRTQRNATPFVLISECEEEISGFRGKGMARQKATPRAAEQGTVSDVRTGGARHAVSPCNPIHPRPSVRPSSASGWVRDHPPSPVGRHRHRRRRPSPTTHHETDLPPHRSRSTHPRGGRFDRLPCWRYMLWRVLGRRHRDGQRPPTTTSCLRLCPLSARNRWNGAGTGM